jgi:hypothetical protein
MAAKNIAFGSHEENAIARPNACTFFRITAGLTPTNVANGDGAVKTRMPCEEVPIR